MNINIQVINGAAGGIEPPSLGWTPNTLPLCYQPHTIFKRK